MSDEIDNIAIKLKECKELLATFRRGSKAEAKGMTGLWFDIDSAAKDLSTGLLDCEMNVEHIQERLEEVHDECE